MKKSLFISVIIFSIIFGTNSEIFSQSMGNGFECSFISPGTQNSMMNPFQGNDKPNTTDWNGPNPSQPQAYFPVLVVFVQFANETTIDPFNSWPAGSAPVFLNSMIATQKNMGSSPWWEKYNPETQSLSSFWLEVSRGTFHVISPFSNEYVNGAFSVVLQHDANYYSNFGWLAEQEINKDIWIDLHRQGLVDWTPYDKWKYNVADGLFYNERDSIVDFIYKIHRSRGIGGMPNVAGFNQLAWHGGSGLVDTVNNIYAEYFAGKDGSGITLSFKGLKDQYIGAVTHEHDHYLSLSGHIQNSKAAYGIGLDNFYSPYDMVLNNYMSPTDANLNSTNNLGDYSSRNSGSGNIIKVPIEGEQFFLLANRNKVSKWDRIMLGDTAQIHPFEDNSEYGKGLYIYHIKNGIHFPAAINDTVQDLECADGYWEWEFKGFTYGREIYNCYKSPNPTFRYYKKKTVLYTNDPSTLGEFDNIGTNYGNPNPWGDGVSFFHRYGNVPWHANWDIGVESQDLCGIGTNRIFTTENNDIYQNSENAGDRYDAWRPGFNEVFSPYSSPSSVKWNNDNSGIFIYYKGYDINGNAEIDIHKVDATHTLQSILEATPPSRPMGLQIDSCFDYNGGKSIKLTWVHNMEPDMERISGETVLKRYKIWRSVSAGNNFTPPDSYLYPENVYRHIATVDCDASTQPFYIENTDSIYSICATVPDGCASYCYNIVHIRYRIQAVDVYDDLSTLSDFEQCRGLKLVQAGGLPGGEEEDFMHRNTNEVIPKEFKLSQNYPNPFNPSTNISYDIPKDVFVTIKIYDISGREIKTLVNEYIRAGRYIIGFNASGLSSGIYFCKIIAGNYIETKRMVLIK